MDKRLFEASLSGDEQALRVLIQHDPLILDRAVTGCEETPLHVAALRGHLSFVRELLRLKPKLASEMDAAGCVPLHLASAEGNTEVVRELLRKNEDLCVARDSYGRTPLHLGVMKGRLDVVRELIRARPLSAMKKLDRGKNVFHLCVKYCRLETLKLMVELLKDDHYQLLVAMDDEGNTVLHFAALFKQIETIRYLGSLQGIEAIANSRNDNGHTAMDVLENCPRDFNSFEILEALTQVGVKRGKDVPKHPNPTTVLRSLPTTTTSADTDIRKRVRIKRWFKHALEYFTMKHHTGWIADTHGNLMVVATVVASMSFQAGINPPGGVWQEDTTHDKDCKYPRICRAGTAVLNYRKETKEDFKYFFSRNTWSLMASVCVILLHFGGFPLKNKVGTWLLTLSMCVMLHNIMAAYVVSTHMVVTPYDDNDTLVHVVLAWSIMLMLIVFIHTIRIWHWLIFDMSTSFCSSWSRSCGCKCLKIVVFLIGNFVTIIVLVQLMIKYAIN